MDHASFMTNQERILTQINAVINAITNNNTDEADIQVQIEELSKQLRESTADLEAKVLQYLDDADRANLDEMDTKIENEEDKVREGLEELRQLREIFDKFKTVSENLQRCVPMERSAP